MIREDFPVPASPHTATLTTPLPPAYPTLSFPGISLSLSLSLCPRVRLALRASSSSPALVAVLFAPLPASRHRFHSKKEKKNENLKISLESLLGIQSKGQQGCGAETCRDGGRIAVCSFGLRITYDESFLLLLLKGNSLATAGNHCGNNNNNNQKTKPSQVLARFLSGAGRGRIEEVSPLPSSLSLSVSMSVFLTTTLAPFFYLPTCGRERVLPLLRALRKVETSNCPLPAPAGDEGKSVGPLQIGFAYHQDGIQYLIPSLSLSLKRRLRL